MARIIPTVGWICTDRWLSAMAKIILDEQYEEAAKLGDADVYCVGRIGSASVAISCLSGPLDSSSVEYMVRNMVTSFSGIQAIIVIGLGCGIPGASVLPGDVAISLDIGHHGEFGSAQTSNVVQRAFCVLKGEVGEDGHWLSNDLFSALPNHQELLQLVQGSNGDLPACPHLHYGPDVHIEKSRHQSASAIKVKHFDTIVAGLKTLSLPRVTVLGVSNNVDSDQNNGLKRYAAANATLYAKEFTQLVSDNVMFIVPDVKNSEKVVPPPTNPILPRFPPHRYPSYGNTILLVIPTANESKRKLLEDAFIEQAPDNVALRTVIVPVDSGVGEQPYNNAGIIGAYNRINNTLVCLNTTQYDKTFREMNVGIVIVASIESYIQLDDVDRPTDYGIVVVYNAATQQTAACSSCGVTVPRTFVDRARRFGFEGDPNRGRVTVGQVLAARIPGLDKADWQTVLAGHSRYALLKDAIEKLPIPW